MGRLGEVALALAPLLVLLGWVCLRWPDTGLRLVWLAQRDDWLGVPALAARTTSRPSWRIAKVTGARARILLGIAELVVGDVGAARTAFEYSLDDSVPARYRAAAERQLATVDRMAGDLVRARDRLGRTKAAASGSDAYSVAVQHGLIELADAAHAAALAVLEGAAQALRARRSSTWIAFNRRAFGADLAQCLALVARARRLVGDLDGSAAALAEASTVADERPMVRGQLALESAQLALARGDQAGAEATLRARGALGELRAVDAARQAISGP